MILEKLKRVRWIYKIRTLNKKIRELKKYEKWRDEVKKRDKRRCARCKAKTIRLEVHHKKPFAQILKENKIRSLREAMSCEELWNLKNGQTLCLMCHRKTKTYWKR